MSDQDNKQIPAPGREAQASVTPQAAQARPASAGKAAPAAKRRGQTWSALKQIVLPPPAGLAVMPGMDAFERTVESVMSRQSTARAQHLVRVTAITLAVLLTWAAFAHVDEVTRGDGKVVPSSQLQVLQALDGGVVSEIKVREGDVVDAGQLLLRIDETRATSGVREASAQGFALQVRVARLRAQAEGSTFKPPAGKDPEDERIIEEERRLYESRMSELSTLMSINRQQVMQRQQEQSEAQARRSAAIRGLDLAQQELNQTRPLLATGAVSQVDVLRLERDVTRNRGEAEGAAAQIARTQAAIGEASRKVQETELQFRNEARKELSEALGKLNALNEGKVALDDKVDKTQVKSPVRGRVQRLMANTVGGVVQPGKDIVEIVPLDDTLMLEARVMPRDIAFLVPGQAANVKFTAYDFSIYGSLEAKVENISPDTEIDEKGNAFYIVRVRTNQSSFGDNLPVLPGMTAEVDILTGRKTVLSYLLKPIVKAKAYALRER